MKKNSAFKDNIAEYNSWYEKHPYVFLSEIEAIRQMLPQGKDQGIEVGCGTGKLCQALGITKGIETSAYMREIAYKNGLEIIDGCGEKLPFPDMHLDYVLFSFCMGKAIDLHTVFMEASRALKNNGALIVAFMDSQSPKGDQYIIHQPFKEHCEVSVNSVDKILFELSHAGFKHFQFIQTLFVPPDEVREIQPAKPGYGEGSFVVVQARKKS